MKPSTFYTRHTNQISIAEMHRNIDIDDLPLPGLEETYPIPRIDAPRCFFKGIREPFERPMYKIGAKRTGKTRILIEESDYFWPCGWIRYGVEKRRRCDARVKEMLYLFIDHFEVNVEATGQLPECPKEFHRTIANVSTMCLMKYDIHTDNIKIYTALHESVKKIKGCENVQFDHFVLPFKLYDDKHFWKERNDNEHLQYLDRPLE